MLEKRGTEGYVNECHSQYKKPSSGTTAGVATGIHIVSKERGPMLQNSKLYTPWPLL